METATLTKWKIDKIHSEVQFKAKHLVISNVTGQFNEFDAELVTEGEGLKNAKAWFTADVDSITTNNNDRDNHLKSEDFFNADKYPKIEFKSSNFSKADDDHYKMTGHLTIRDITREISLDVIYGGSMVDPYGANKAGFEIFGKINRHEFGLKWNAMTEAGGVVVGEDIRLALNIQMAQN